MQPALAALPVAVSVQLETSAGSLDSAAWIEARDVTENAGVKTDGIRGEETEEDEDEGRCWLQGSPLSRSRRCTPPILE